MSEKKLKKNVLDFIGKCSKEVGNWKAENFDQEIWCDCVENNGLNSPIEQILYCALKYIQTLNQIDDYDDRYNFIAKKPYSTGLLINSQSIINKYRCDFSVFYVGFNREPIQLIIECDSQIFHERTEKERRYEKARDRHLTIHGYKVFHYTGSEIVKRPLEIAIEILAYVTERFERDFIKDSNCE